MFISTQCSVVLAFIRKDQWVLGGYKKIQLRSARQHYEIGKLELQSAHDLRYTCVNNKTINFMLGLSKFEMYLVRRAFMKKYDSTMFSEKDERTSNNRREVIDIITGMKDD